MGQELTITSLALEKSAMTATLGLGHSTTGMGAPGNARLSLDGHVLSKACALRYAGMAPSTTTIISATTATTSMGTAAMRRALLREATTATMETLCSDMIGAMKFAETVLTSVIIGAMMATHSRAMVALLSAMWREVTHAWVGLPISRVRTDYYPFRHLH